MVQRKFEKTAGIVIAALILIEASIFSPVSFGLSLHHGSSIAARFLYPLLHASFFHALVNAWCMLSIIFFYPVSWQNIGAAWIISAMAPPFTISDIPTIGLSAICFALLGMLVFKVAHKWLFIFYIAPYLLLGFFIPYINAALHLFAFCAGAFAGLFTAPIPCKRN